MRSIIKKCTPGKLIAYKKSKQCTYSGMDSEVKNEMKYRMLKEQGFVCCYCMKRISHDEMKIEHLKPQSKFPSESLNYENMFAACLGNEGSHKKAQTCDTHKGNEELKFNLLDKKLDTCIKYTSDGEIMSSVEEIDKDINEVLNLNSQSLKNNRRAAMEAIKEQLTKKKPRGIWDKTMLTKILKDTKGVNGNNKYSSYYGVKIYYVEKLMKRCK